MQNIVIVEDEKPAARRLERMLKDLNMEVLIQLNSVEAAISWFKNNQKVDLIFLDIQLSDGLSFEIFEAVDIQASIIFTTAYDEYALRAFKLNSIDYLLKPIDPYELKTAVEKYKKFNSTNTIDAALIQSLMQQHTTEQNTKTRFAVKVGNHIKTFNTEEITCFYSEYKATSLLSRDGKNYVMDESLNQLENQLSSSQFFRVNRSHIVNFDAIQDIVAYSSSRLKLVLQNCDHKIVVSRERVSTFKTWLG
ncbi:LytR/AlgR family response regulator transcription factor [Psychroflexus aestuariivivens]|uniref:LytR/AlgR family response regulator transcription factor n=1 Tax=Psychroflexus aestuariivivens TaxID=1795040 RepID=UPI000FD6C718|nr:LytTR family DNA-binding domain-containing protein [Psychroflexus aestuariivivens]